MAAPPAAPSLLRGFSAPVKVTLSPPLSEDALAFCAAHDSDPFCRWEAASKLAVRAVLARRDADAGAADDDASAAAAAEAAAASSLARLVSALRSTLAAAAAGSLDGALAAEVLTFPDAFELLAAAGGPGDPVAAFAAREAVLASASASLRPELIAAVESADAAAAAEGGVYAFEKGAVARRALRNTALSLLCRLGGVDLSRAEAALSGARCMTDEIAALHAVLRSAEAWRGDKDGRPTESRAAAAAAAFGARWAGEPLVVVKWLGAQAASPAPGGAARVRALLASPHFVATTPNHNYAVLGGAPRQLISAKFFLPFCLSSAILTHFNTFPPRLRPRQRPRLPRRRRLRLRPALRLSADARRFEPAVRGALRGAPHPGCPPGRAPRSPHDSPAAPPGRRPRAVAQSGGDRAQVACGGCGGGVRALLCCVRRTLISH